jgi:hypothetical protein
MFSNYCRYSIREGPLHAVYTKESPITLFRYQRSTNVYFETFTGISQEINHDGIRVDQDKIVHPSFFVKPYRSNGIPFYRHKTESFYRTVQKYEGMVFMMPRLLGIPEELVLVRSEKNIYFLETRYYTLFPFI